jgi:hypothetical protein
LFASFAVRLDAGVLVCSLAALCLQRQGRERERKREREREREEKREREGDNGLRLAVPCLAGSPYFSVVRVPPLGIVPMTVLHHGNPDEQREREREMKMVLKRGAERSIG